MSELLKDVADRSESEDVIRENMENMKQTAKKVIAENGYDYEVDVYLKDTDFPVKSYGMYTFPAGTYEALEIVIGEGKGHNWWCVMYPPLCVPCAGTALTDEEIMEKYGGELSEEDIMMLTEESDYEARLYIAELFEKIFDTNL